MMLKRSGLFLLFVGCVAVGGCASFSGLAPFRFTPNGKEMPEASVEELAKTIESQVFAGNRDMNLTAPEGLILGDAVVQAARTRAIRADLVKNLLRSGYAVEQRNGTVALIRNREYRQATSSRERDRNALIIMSENTDRWTIYEGLVRDSKLKGSSLPAIQRIFYRARIPLLEPGMKYEDESGQTVTR